MGDASLFDFNLGNYQGQNDPEHIDNGSGRGCGGVHDSTNIPGFGGRQ